MLMPPGPPPDYAMSAGTIFCMSGDEIYMDYSSALGPIDPQVFNGDTWVPALGYLEKVAELVQKSHDGKLSDAEYMILANQDLAELAQYEQQRDLTITLRSRRSCRNRRTARSASKSTTRKALRWSPG